MIMLNNKRERKRAREEESRYKSLLRVQIINAKAQMFKFYQFSTKSYKGMEKDLISLRKCCVP